MNDNADLKFRVKGFRLTLVRAPRDHSNYRPAKCYDLGPDQCRFVIDADYTMCGKKGFPWCDEHRARITDRGGAV